MPIQNPPPTFPDDGSTSLLLSNPDLSAVALQGLPPRTNSQSNVLSQQLIRSLSDLLQQQLVADRWSEVLQRLNQIQSGIGELNQYLRASSSAGVGPVGATPMPPLAAAAAATATELLPAGVAPAQDIELVDDRQVFSLIYANSRDPSIGAGCGMNAAFVESLLKTTCGTNLAHSQTRFDFTQPSILADVKRQEPGPSDVLFVYIATHGVFANGTKHMLLSTRSAGNRADIDRKALFEAIRKSKAGLKILISDACGSVSGAVGAAAAVRGARTLTYPFFTLLFSTSGEVNVNAAHSPEYALYISVNSTGGGGVFTRTFCDEAVYGAPPKSSNLKEWDRFFNSVGKKANQVVLPNVRLPDGSTRALRQPFPCKFDSAGREIPYPVT
jgi:hypothetical protein